MPYFRVNSILSFGPRETGKPVFPRNEVIVYIGGMFSEVNGTVRARRPMAASTKFKFPCPVCAGVRDVRLTKKDKPYITCDPCGIQVFVRGPAGIAEFNRLIERNNEGLFVRLEEMERRYRLACPACGFKFWPERTAH
jgi:predicted RNA-binding Zn-ribbon protein involved in translation (DUF1610 family)